ncbi:hypothetical protein QCA50_009152 [Cerrena zonata]|uniref:Ataxin-10 homolog n=1 Tax=Cerrena zonata TaxID=2478898 RepID=A0AAW0GDA2_9APHY
MRMRMRHILLSLYSSGEVVTPHQTTLLKLLDSYLHTEPQQNSEPLTPSRRHDLTRLFVQEFFTLAAYAQNAICRSLGIDQTDARSEPLKETSQSLKDRAFSFSPNGTDDDDSSLRLFPMEELDLVLPKVCEALVLVTQCITSLTLHAAEDKNGNNDKEAGTSPTVSLSPADSDSLKVYVANAHSATNMGFVESLLDTLRLVDRFLPRITLGQRVSPSPLKDASGKTPESPDENIRTAGAKAQSEDPKGFMYLKRDLVRLLGILAYRSKGVQDRVRLCEGIPVVLNMCVIDERNPYLREHAIFALRNILGEQCREPNRGKRNPTSAGMG